MYSSEEKLDEFIKKYSGPQDILLNLCKNEKDRTTEEIELINKEFEKTKEYLVKEANELFKHKTFNFESSISNFKYKVEPLGIDEPDYKVLKNSVGLDCLPDVFADQLGENYKQSKDKKVAFKIFRVTLNNNVLKESEDSKDSSLLLLHGTNGKNVEGILKEGFRPSRSGLYGPRVYLTDSFKYAFEHGICLETDKGVAKHMSYVFVNKVVQNKLHKTRHYLNYFKNLFKNGQNKLNSLSYPLLNQMLPNHILKME